MDDTQFGHENLAEKQSNWAAKIVSECRLLSKIKKKTKKTSERGERVRDISQKFNGAK